MTKPKTRRVKARKSTAQKAEIRDLKGWGQRMLSDGKSWGTVVLTHLFVRSAAEIYRFEQEISQGEISWIKSSAPDPNWEHFYRRPDKMFQQLVDYSCPWPADAAAGPSEEPLPGLGTFVRGVSILARGLKRTGDAELRQQMVKLLATPEGRAAAMEGFELGRKLRQRDLDELLGLDDEMPDEMFHTGVGMRPIQFFMLVWIPCLIGPGRSPQELFQQAERGCLDALETLLQVDKRLLWCPTLAKLVDEASRQRRNGRYAELMKAMSGSPAALGVGTFKCALGAYILRMDESLRTCFPGKIKRLTSLDLRGAFDAAARERGLLIDEDLPSGRESYRKAIQRHRKFAYSRVWDMFSV